MDQFMGDITAKLGLWKLFDVDSGMQSLYQIEAFTDLPID